MTTGVELLVFVDREGAYRARAVCGVPPYTITAYGSAESSEESACAAALRALRTRRPRSHQARNEHAASSDALRRTHK